MGVLKMENTRVDNYKLSEVQCHSVAYAYNIIGLYLLVSVGWGCMPGPNITISVMPPKFLDWNDDILVRLDLS